MVNTSRKTACHSELFRREIIDFPRNLTEHFAGIKHEHLVAMRLGLTLVEEPEFARHRARAKEIGSDRDHDVQVAGLDDFSANIRSP